VSAAPASDADVLARHREVWAGRPELRAVYGEWFDALLAAVDTRRPVVELGAGPGFFKEYASGLIAIDLVRSPWIDVVAEGGALPLRTASVGAIVMIDTLHHLPAPLRFLDEAVRVLRAGGRLAMVEPWITPCSYVLYRFLHHEDCRLRAELARPFGTSAKRALDGNAAIPLKWLRHVAGGDHGLRLVRAEPFVALPYLVTLGFQRRRPVPAVVMRIARRLETLTRRARGIGASRILAVWERTPARVTTR
jgi:SAM-dependent methyltransferase